MSTSPLRRPMPPTSTRSSSPAARRMRTPSAWRNRRLLTSKAFVEAGKPVAAICHGPWALVEADVLHGKTLTSYPSLKTDIRNAGGQWKDEEVFVCTANEWTLVTSRKPDDLPAFDKAIVKAISGS